MKRLFVVWSLCFWVSICASEADDITKFEYTNVAKNLSWISFRYRLADGQNGVCVRVSGPRSEFYRQVGYKIVNPLVKGDYLDLSAWAILNRRFNNTPVHQKKLFVVHE